MGGCSPCTRRSRSIRCLNQGARYSRRILPIVSDLYCLTDVERAHELLSFSKAIVRKPLRGLVGSCGDRAEYRVLGEVCLFQSAGVLVKLLGTVAAITPSFGDMSGASTLAEQPAVQPSCAAAAPLITKR
jgi:hypothetical protein